MDLLQAIAELIVALIPIALGLVVFVVMHLIYLKLTHDRVETWEDRESRRAEIWSRFIQ